MKIKEENIKLSFLFQFQNNSPSVLLNLLSTKKRGNQKKEKKKPHFVSLLLSKKSLFFQTLFSSLPLFSLSLFPLFSLFLFLFLLQKSPSRFDPNPRSKKDVILAPQKIIPTHSQFFSVIIQTSFQINSVSFHIPSYFFLCKKPYRMSF